MTRALLLGVLALALTGCGTVQNFADGWDGRTRPYGGVRLAAKGIADSHDVELTFTWPFRLADLALSAVGDTLTLPLSLPIALAYAIHDGICDYYFPKGRPPQAPDREPPPGSDRPPGSGHE